MTQSTDDHSGILITRKHTDEYLKRAGLKNDLTLKYLCGIGVGAVISGQYFGWNYGLSHAGPLGFLLTMAIVTFAYIFIVIILSRLSTILPYTGGPYAYARKGLGPMGGFIAGASTSLAFLFAASALTLAIGSYFSLITETVPSKLIAVLCFAVFIVVNMLGVRESATIEAVVTLLSLSGIVLFIIVGAASINFAVLKENLSVNSGAKGIMGAIPYAIWFYICIEGLTLTAEETKNPSRNVPAGLFISLAIMIISSFSVFAITISTVRYTELEGINYPLSYVVERTNSNGVLSVLFTLMTLFGLLASLSGVIMGYSREFFALARAGYFPRVFSRISKYTKTPYLTTILPGFAGILFAFTLSVEHLISLTVFCILIMFLLVIASYLKMAYKKRNKSHIFFAAAALFLVASFLISYIVLNLHKGLVFLGIHAVMILYYFLLARKNIVHDAPEEAESEEVNFKVVIKD